MSDDDAPLVRDARLVATASHGAREANPTKAQAELTIGEPPSVTEQLPDLPIYMSAWRAALLLTVTMPFLLFALVLARLDVGDMSLSLVAKGIILIFAISMGVVPIVWVLKYRRGRGPMYVFTQEGLVVGNEFAGRPIPWRDVWISWPFVMAGPFITNVDYRRPEYRCDPFRRGGPRGIYLDANRHQTMRRIVMPNISTCGNRGLERTLKRYVRAAGLSA